MLSSIQIFYGKIESNSPCLFSGVFFPKPGDNNIKLARAKCTY
jgi:hypothetical protein